MSLAKGLAQPWTSCAATQSTLIAVRYQDLQVALSFENIRPAGLSDGVSFVLGKGKTGDLWRSVEPPQGEETGGCRLHGSIGRRIPRRHQTRGRSRVGKHDMVLGGLSGRNVV